jgi:transcriptional regulator with XRE-family HTH domain
MSHAMKTVVHFLEEKEMSIPQLAKVSGLEVQRVKAIAEGNYTASPSDRQRLADALEVLVEDIAWGHTVPVEHLRGNGPQCGRST